MAAALQHDQTTQQPWLKGACTEDNRSAKLAVRLRYATPAIQLGHKTNNALTWKPDQSEGAGHWPS